MPRKPRSDSKLDALPKMAKADLELWMVEENRPYLEVKSLLEETHGIETSTGALSNYYGKRLAVLRIEQAREACNGLKAVATGGDEFVERAVFALSQRFFTEAVQGEMSIKEIKALASIIAAKQAAEIKMKELALAERRVVVMENKAAAFDEGKGIMESQLTEKEKGQRLRQLFGMQ